MPFTTLAEYKTALANTRPISFGKFGVGGDVNTWVNAYLVTGVPTDAAPTSSVALSRSSAGAPPGLFASSSAWHCLSIVARQTTSLAAAHNYARGGMLVDRLVHQGGLSAIVTTEQTTNLPTTTLPRYTSGVGVLAAVQIYGAIGTTPTTFTIRYTNSAGTANQVSVANDIGGSVNQYARTATFRIVPLADGDLGVKSVEGVTLAASTGTAGNIGVVLFKPLLGFNIGTGLGFSDADALLGGATFPEVDDDACLDFLANNANQSGAAPQIIINLGMTQLA